jgi:hypothetical protein
MDETLKQITQKYWTEEWLKASKEFATLSPELQTQAISAFKPQIAQATTPVATVSQQLDKTSPAYKELNSMWYTDQDILNQSAQIKQPIVPNLVSQPVTEWLPAPAQLATQKEVKTKLPDFQDDSDKRLKEIANNLKAYEKVSPSLFTNRDTFNKSFNYIQRTPAQQSVLDSFWEWKQLQLTNQQNQTQFQNDINKLNLLSWQQLVDRWLTDSEALALKQTDPAKYKEYQSSLDNKNKLAIINWESSTLWGITDNLFSTQISVPNISQIYNEKMATIKPLQEDLNKKKAELKDLETQMSNILDDTRKQLEWKWATDSYVRALASKRLEEITPEYTAKTNAYNSALDEYKTMSGNVENEIKLFQDQYNMDRQAQADKLQSLWFAFDIFQYQNQPKRELEMMQAKYDFENPDINSSDPTAVKKALNNSLTDYYKDFWIIIQRPKEQVINDVMQYAKDKWISVSQALQENFIKPLQNKTEYQAIKNKVLGIETPEQQKWNYTVDENGNIKVEVSWAWWLPAELTRQQGINMAKSLNNMTWWNSQLLWSAIQNNFKDWTTYGQCWEFANDIYKWITNTWTNIFGNTYESKVNAINNIWISNTPVVWGFVVMKSATSWENWHVWVVTSVNPDWTFNMKSSNYKWDEKIRTDENISTKWKTFSIAPTSWWIEISDSDILNFNDITSRRDMSDSNKNLVASAKSAVMSDPNSSMEEILRYSQWWKTPTDSISTPLIKYQQALDQIESLSKDISNIDTWPIKWILNSNNPYNVKAQEIKAKLTALVPTLARWVYWEVWVLTDADISNYIKTIPNLKSTKEVNQALLAMTLDSLANWYKKRLSTVAWLWYDVSWLIWAYESLQNQAENVKTTLWINQPQNIWFSMFSQWAGNIASNDFISSLYK